MALSSGLSTVLVHRVVCSIAIVAAVGVNARVRNFSGNIVVAVVGSIVLVRVATEVVVELIYEVRRNSLLQILPLVGNPWCSQRANVPIREE